MEPENSEGSKRKINTRERVNGYQLTPTSPLILGTLPTTENVS